MKIYSKVLFSFFIISTFFVSDVFASLPPATNYSNVNEAFLDGPNIINDMIREVYPTSTCESFNWSIFLKPRIQFCAGCTYRADIVSYNLQTDPVTCVDYTGDDFGTYTYENKTYLIPSRVPLYNWSPRSTVWESGTLGATWIAGINHYQTNSMNRDYTILSKTYTSVDLTKSTEWSVDFGSGYGNLGTLANVGPFLFAYKTHEPSGAVYNAPTVPNFTFDRYIEYKNNYVLTSYQRLEFTGDCIIDPITTVGPYPLSCDTSFELYTINGTSKVLLDSSSSDYPPFLQVNDIDNPCANILKSNYVLKDTNGNYICEATVNPIIDDLAPPYNGIINFDKNSYDWGSFNFLLDPAEILFDSIDNVVGWFYGLWSGFLDLIIPKPDFLAFTFQDVKNIADEKFSQIDLTSLEAFEDITTSELPTITTNLMGVQVQLINFDLVKDNIDIIRGIMIASAGLFLVIFNVNQINKLLADNSVTES